MANDVRILLHLVETDTVIRQSMTLIAAPKRPLAVQ